MTRQKVIDRIQKLLALAESPNEHEAAHARRRANALKRKYKIKKAELGDREVRRQDAGPESADPYWRMNLALAIGNRWKCISSKKDGRFWFEGRDADRAVRMYAHLAAEIIGACHGSWRRELRGRAGSLYLVWSTTFKAEAVRAIAERLSGHSGAVVAPSVPVARSQSAPVWPDLDVSTTEAKKGPKTPDEIQLERARAEVDALIRDLASSVGFFAAQTFAAQVVERAAKAGRAFGLRVYLGDGERLLAGYSATGSFLESAARLIASVAQKAGLR